jgi:biofilm protein TabA
MGKMILGDIRNWNHEKGAYHSAIVKGIDYILHTDISELDPGRYEIQGDEIFALIQEVQTKPILENKPESHAQYIDIQYLIRGVEEVIGVSRVGLKNEVAENKFETKDIAFYKSVETESFIKMHPGMFVVFFPSDIHRPCCYENHAGLIKKVVIKINSCLLKEPYAVPR